MSPEAISGLLAVAPLVWLLIFLVRRRKGTEAHRARLAAMSEPLSMTRLVQQSRELKPVIPQPPGLSGK